MHNNPLEMTANERRISAKSLGGFMKFKNYGEARKFCEKFGLKLNARDPIYIPYFDVADALVVALNTSPPNMEIQSDAEGGSLDSDIRLPKDISDFRYHKN